MTHTVTLGDALDMTAAGPLVAELLGHRGQPVSLNAAGVRRLGGQCLQVLESSRPDVIITDINMPRMDGFGFIEAVRGSGTHRAIPILVLTTESVDDKKERARRAGASGWIIKPFDRAKLVTAINRVAA